MNNDAAAYDSEANPSNKDNEDDINQPGLLGGKSDDKFYSFLKVSIF